MNCNYLPSLPDATVWLPIPSHPIYEICAAGFVRNTKTGRVLANHLHRSASRYYVACRLGFVHRLLMEAQTGRTLGRHEQVRHLDGDTFNNAPVNLSIGTARDNAFDRITHNTNGRKLRNGHVREIRALSARLDKRKLANRFGVSAATISDILTGRTWGNLP